MQRRAERRRKKFGEDLLPAFSCVAPEASYDDLELDAPITEWKIGGTALIAALDAT